MVKFGFPLAPFILGVILGDQIEINLVRSLMTDSNLWLFVTRPISALLLGAAVASIALSIWQHRRMQKKTAAADGAADFFSDMLTWLLRPPEPLPVQVVPDLRHFVVGGRSCRGVLREKRVTNYQISAIAEHRRRHHRSEREEYVQHGRLPCKFPEEECGTSMELGSVTACCTRR